MDDFEKLEDIDALANEISAFINGRQDMQTRDVVACFAHLCDVLELPRPAWMVGLGFPDVAPPEFLAR